MISCFFAFRVLGTKMQDTVPIYFSQKSVFKKENNPIHLDVIASDYETKQYDTRSFQ